MKTVLLSFDVEEFDVPVEYGVQLTLDEQLRISEEGLGAILALLDKYAIKATFYCTAVFVEHNAELIRGMAASGHEIASHTFAHSKFKKGDGQRSKEAIEKCIRKEIYGFRMPQMQAVATDELVGYYYNSSINPTWIPGRYNNLNVSRTYFKEKHLWQLPASVTPFTRIPLFWLSFHNFPLWLYRSFFNSTIKKDNYANIYFHPWEFTDLNKFSFPFFLKRNSGTKMMMRFEKFLLWCIDKNFEFKTTYDYLSKI